MQVRPTRSVFFFVYTHASLMSVYNSTLVCNLVVSSTHTHTHTCAALSRNNLCVYLLHKLLGVREPCTFFSSILASTNIMYYCAVFSYVHTHQVCNSRCLYTLTHTRPVYVIRLAILAKQSVRSAKPVHLNISLCGASPEIFGGSRHRGFDG